MTVGPKMLAFGPISQSGPIRTGPAGVAVLSAYGAAGIPAGTLLVDPVAVDGVVVADAHWPGLEGGRLQEFLHQLCAPAHQCGIEVDFGGQQP